MNFFDNIIFFLACVILAGGAGCKKLVEVDSPVTSSTTENAFASDATAISVLTGLYIKLSGSAYPGGYDVPNTSFWLGLVSDEFTLWNGSDDRVQNAYFINSLASNAVLEAGSNFWAPLYANIFSCNAAIEGLTKSTTLTPSVKAQLIGESKFIRSLCYFYLVNLYGEVPLAVSTDYKINAVLSRSPVSSVYQLIIQDLREADSLLNEHYVDASLLNTSQERTRPNKWAARALLSRVYLYSANWEEAATTATSIINNTSLFNLTDPDHVFTANSTEAIWQLQPVTSGYATNTLDAKWFILPPTGLSFENPVYLNNRLVEEFDQADQRLHKWIAKYTDTTVVPYTEYYYSYKYKVNEPDATVSEYLMMLRLAEQYLIRAEAKAELGDIEGASLDLNTIRNRAELENMTFSSKDELLAAILKERRKELFTESGHRWLDIKRTGAADAIMEVETPLKGGSWLSHYKWFPIPHTDIQKNQHLSQNTGY